MWCRRAADFRGALVALSVRVVIVAAGRAAAEAVRRGIAYAPLFEVVGYVDAGTPCGPAVAAAAPTLVLVDDSGDHALVLERVAEVAETVPAAKLILLTSTMEEEWVADAAAAGAEAIVSKALGSSSLAHLVREIARGTVYHSFSRRPPDPPVSALHEQLTARELEVLRLAAGGASNSHIASQLWVTEQTVKFHLSNTYRKLGVSNRTEASHQAHLYGLFAADGRPDDVSRPAIAA